MPELRTNPRMTAADCGAIAVSKLPGFATANYSRPDLSPLGLYATRSIVESGPLQLTSWKETPDKRYDPDASRLAFPRLRSPSTFDEIAASGAEVVLTKARTFARQLASSTSRSVGALARRVRRSPFKRNPGS